MLIVKELAKTYNNRDFAIKDLSFALGKGRVSALLGHNGAGKSTTLRIVASILAPTRGEVSIEGTTLEPGNSESLREIKRKIGFLPEDPFLVEQLTPREYLFYIGKLYGIEDDDELEDRIAYLINLFEIEEPGTKFLSEYSSGLKKRTALASALVNRPALLLLDEPTNNLDPVGVKMFKEHLLKLKAGGASILLATHRLEFAERVADHIIVLEGGRAKFQGSLDELQRELDSARTGSSLEELYSLLAAHNPA